MHSGNALSSFFFFSGTNQTTNFDIGVTSQINKKVLARLKNGMSISYLSRFTARRNNFHQVGQLRNKANQINTPKTLKRT